MPKPERDISSSEVAIVVPAYNAAAHIGTLYESVLGQLSEVPYPITLLVVDDGSSDETAELIKSLPGDRGVSVRAIYRKANTGRSQAINSGLDAAVGCRYVVLMDVDCIFTSKNSLATAIKHLDAGIKLVLGRLEPLENTGSFWARYQQNVFERRLQPAMPLEDYSSALLACEMQILERHRFHIGYTHYGFEDKDFFLGLKPICGDEWCLEPKFSARTECDSSLFVLSAKMKDCGRFSSAVFIDRHPLVYASSRYRRFDCRYMPRIASTILSGLIRLLPLGLQVGEYLIAAKGVPYFVKARYVQALMGISYFAGSCQRDAETV